MHCSNSYLNLPPTFCCISTVLQTLCMRFLSSALMYCTSWFERAIVCCFVLPRPFVVWVQLLLLVTLTMLCLGCSSPSCPDVI